jgi:hypothetical protein
MGFEHKVELARFREIAGSAAFWALDLTPFSIF